MELYADPSEAHHFMHHKFPASVMAFGVISNEAHILPSNLFQLGLRLNSAGYTEVLEIVMKLWLEVVCIGRPYVFLQDSVAAHKAVVTQDCMSANMHNHITPNMWTPNSPDVNPLEYYMCLLVELESNQRSHNATDSLKAANTRVISSINTDHVTQRCHRFLTCIEVIIASEGSYIE